MDIQDINVRCVECWERHVKMYAECAYTRDKRDISFLAQGLLHPCFSPLIQVRNHTMICFLGGEFHISAWTL